jgi:hypothetical protein
MKNQKIIVFFSLLVVAALLCFFIFRKQDSTYDSMTTRKKEPNQKRIELNESKINIKSFDTVYLEIDVKKTTNIQFNIFGVLKKGEIPLSEGYFFRKNQSLAEIDFKQNYIELSNLKIDLRDEITTIISQEPLFKTSDIYTKWDDFKLKLDIQKALPEFPDIFLGEEMEIIRQSSIPRNYVKSQQIEQQIKQCFYLAPFDGQIWTVNKKFGESINKGEVIAKIIEQKNIQISSKKFDASTNEFKIYNENDQQIGTIKFLKISNEKIFWRFSPLANNKYGLLPGKTYYLIQEKSQL